MRLLPAHTREAKDMAKRLKEAFLLIGLPRDFRDPESGPPSLQQTQELMARAMGYEGGWKELSSLTAQPHTPVYIDGLDGDEQTSVNHAAVARLCNLIGIDYMHGMVWNAWTNAGVGYSPKWRRRFEDLSTPWGPIDEQEEIAPGILCVTTGSHGGYVLSEDRQQMMPSHLRLDAPYYEEDCDWALVALAFPSELEDLLSHALSSVEVYKPGSVPRIRISGSKQEEFLAEHMVGYTPPELDLMNREITQDELDVIAYLARCVHFNKRPVREPSERWPSLQDWVQTLASGPLVDGTWPMLEGPWKPHWGQWQRQELEDQEWEEEQDRIMAEIEARSKESPNSPSN